MKHNPYHAYKSFRTYSVLAKEGQDAVYTETIKYYYDARGLNKLEVEQKSNKAVLDAYDKVAAQKETNDLLAEIAAVK